METVPEWFNNALRDIGGLNRFGEPRYRLVDGRTARRWDNGPLKYLSHYTTEWKEGFVNGIWTKQKVVTAHGIERYVVEEWWPPELCLPKWEQRRYYYDPDTGKVVDLLGPPPVRGMYRAWLTLEDAQGNPLPPSQIVLDFVAACIRWTEKQSIKSETAEPDAKTVEAQVRELLERQERIQNAFGNAVYDMITNAFAASQHRLLLANPTEGLEAHHRRDPDWDRNWHERLQQEKKAAKETDDARSVGHTISLST